MTKRNSKWSKLKNRIFLGSKQSRQSQSTENICQHKRGNNLKPYPNSTLGSHQERSIDCRIGRKLFPARQKISRRNSTQTQNVPRSGLWKFCGFYKRWTSCRYQKTFTGRGHCWTAAIEARELFLRLTTQFFFHKVLISYYITVKSIRSFPPLEWSPTFFIAYVLKTIKFVIDRAEYIHFDDKWRGVIIV